MTLLLEGDTLANVTATHHHVPTPAMPPPGRYRTARRSPGGVIALVVVGLIATAALIVGIVGLARDNSTPAVAQPIATPEGPTFSTAEATAAKQKICAVFEQTNQAVNVATNAALGSEPAGVRAGGRAAVMGAALALTRAVSDATPADVKDKANGLADAYVDYALTAFAERPSDTSAVESARMELQSACA